MGQPIHSIASLSAILLCSSPLQSPFMVWVLLRSTTLTFRHCRSLFYKPAEVKDFMDPAERRYLEEEDTPLMKTIKGGTTGLVAGTIWGMIVASWHDVPRVERNVALPGLLRTLRMMGSYGTTFAAIGGVYIGVEQLVQHQRMKRDFINGAVGGFVAGATILGYRGRSISTAIKAGSALAFTSAVIDVGGQTTRIDNGKEYYPYTTKERPTVK